MSDERPETEGYQLESMFQLSLRSGLLIGASFVIQAIALLLYNGGVISSILFMAGAIGVPINLYRLGKRYRDNYRGGYVRYLELTNFLTWTFLASLVIAFLAFYISTSILFSDSTFISMMEESIELLTQMSQETDATYQEGLKLLRNITPLQLTWSLIANILVQGFIYIYIISLFIKRQPERIQ